MIFNLKIRCDLTNDLERNKSIHRVWLGCNTRFLDFFFSGNSKYSNVTMMRYSTLMKNAEISVKMGTWHHFNSSTKSVVTA